MELLLLEYCRVVWQMGCNGLSAIQGYGRPTQDLIQHESQRKGSHLTYMDVKGVPMKEKSQGAYFNVLQKTFIQRHKESKV